MRLVWDDVLLSTPPFILIFIFLYHINLIYWCCKSYTPLPLLVPIGPEVQVLFELLFSMCPFFSDPELGWFH